MVSDEAVESITVPVHELYYHAVSKQLFVGNYKEGILIYDMRGTGKIVSCQSPNNVEVNQIVALNAHELLVAISPSTGNNICDVVPVWVLYQVMLSL